LVEQFPGKSLLWDYYSEVRVMSDEARHAWLSPDLMQLEDSQLSCPRPAHDPANDEDFPQY